VPDFNNALMPEINLASEDELTSSIAIQIRLSIYPSVSAPNSLFSTQDRVRSPPQFEGAGGVVSAALDGDYPAATRSRAYPYSKTSSRSKASAAPPRYQHTVRPANFDLAINQHDQLRLKTVRKYCSSLKLGKVASPTYVPPDLA